MRTIFSVYGYGLGHATRVDAIAKEFGKENVKIIASGDAYKYFEKENYNPIKIESVKIGNFLEGFSWIQTLFQNIDFFFNVIADYSIIKKTINEFKPDVFISDSEPVSLLYFNSTNIFSVFLSNILPILEEYPKIENKTPQLESQEIIIKLLVDKAIKNSDLIVSPTIKKYKTISKIKFTDLIVRKKPNELKSCEEIRNYYGLPDNYTLVSFGGANIGNEYFSIIYPLLKEIKSRCFVISSNYAVKKVQKKGNIIIYPFIDDYLSFLKASDSVICLAGHSTISEALVYKKPIFTIPIKNHIEQLTNAYIVRDEGYGEFSLLNNVKTKLNMFFENKEVYLKNIKRKNFKGNGAREIFKIISKQLKNKKDFK